ncbi:Uncharacterized protein BM_BM17496 [Brugia malayi]|uniref:Uncharacterized protein n=1 Tax=Brugia malayi TaxID=6279 RepID=A0A4E9FBN9_BRUMA|nr:Uncharacterized protein BM_BM17496 [Brugia malayi]VIO93646.1 Uncharacterized protein BM_BM17496 [Brugia malayi]
MVDIPGSWHQNIFREFIGLADLALSNFCKRLGVRSVADLVHEPLPSGFLPCFARFVEGQEQARICKAYLEV